MQTTLDKPLKPVLVLKMLIKKLQNVKPVSQNITSTWASHLRLFLNNKLVVVQREYKSTKIDNGLMFFGILLESDHHSRWVKKYLFSVGQIHTDTEIKGPRERERKTDRYDAENENKKLRERKISYPLQLWHSLWKRICHGLWKEPPLD